MTDLLPFAENILSHTGTASLDGGKSNFNYTGRYFIGRRAGKQYKFQTTRTSSQTEKDIKMPIILNDTQCPAILDAEKESFRLLHSQAPYQITHYHDYRPGWAIYCESLNSEYQCICQDQISLYMFTNKYLIEY